MLKTTGEPSTQRPRLWTYQSVDEQRAQVMKANPSLSRTLAELLARLGLENPEEVDRFLHPRLRDLGDPFEIGNLEAAVQRIDQALQNRERCVIIGDYDVDGVTSTTFLVALLRELGGDPTYLVPLRMEEGYGLSRGAIERALESGPVDLLIAVDCGTNSVEEVRFLRENGIDVIILDHHRSKEETPQDCLIVNPFLDDRTDHPWTRLCSVGLVFKVAHGLLKFLRSSGDPRGTQFDLKEFLDLTAMGTVADMVPLREENRILARHGIERLSSTRRPGLQALFKVAGIKPGDPLRPTDISFRIGPRINASGRLGDASLTVDMLLDKREAFCHETARQLDTFNTERQAIERQIVLAAEAKLKALVDLPPGIVLFDQEWHQGVVGIVSSRISRKYLRPTIVLGWEGSMAKGSGRSVPGLSLVDVLEQCDHLLTSWGGHPQAVGVALDPENLPAFQEAFAALVQERLGDTVPQPELALAGWLELDEIDDHLLQDLDQMRPFGIGNEEPVFGIRGLQLYRKPLVFAEHHFRFQTTNSRGYPISAVGWKMADRLPPENVPLELACRINRNHYRGRTFLQLEILDWRPAKMAPREI